MARRARRSSSPVGGTGYAVDIDWQGDTAIGGKARADVVSVFHLPPSAPDLEKRLHTVRKIQMRSYGAHDRATMNEPLG